VTHEYEKIEGSKYGIKSPLCARFKENGCGM
jgi:hypothetical protein